MKDLLLFGLICLPIASFRACDLEHDYRIGVGPTGRSSTSSSGGVGSTDSDADGLGDDVEESIETEVRISDSDNDGFADGLEFVGQDSDPLDADQIPTQDTRSRVPGSDDFSGADRDGDGLSDAFETANELDADVADTDGDGYDDGLELVAGSDPFVSDDVPERDAPPALNPNNPTGSAPTDSDRDGLSDSQEQSTGSSSSSADSDQDGFSDGLEFLMGSDASSDQSIPNFNVPSPPVTTTLSSSTTSTASSGVTTTTDSAT